MRVVGADLRLSTEPCGNTPCYHFGRDLSALKRITDLLSLLLAHRAFFYPPLGGLPHFFSHIFGDRFAALRLSNPLPVDIRKSTASQRR